MLRHLKSSTPDDDTGTEIAVTSSSTTPPPTSPSGFNWKHAVTQSLRVNCMAPSADDITHAYDLYCDELDAPFLEIEQEQGLIYEELVESIGALKSLAPEIVERALAQHAVEYSRPEIEDGRS
ncbi:hypothetical protein [Coralliovum pocilloporae]|uniref:hypothetical protein n=1 Tax=Coralliovum pocilloporae TaxID=3066369 RepID=UPI00330748E8